MDLYDAIVQHWKEDAPRLVSYDRNRCGSIARSTFWVELNSFLSPEEGPKIPMYMAWSASDRVRFFAFADQGYLPIRDAFGQRLPDGIPEETRAAVKHGYACAVTWRFSSMEGGFEIEVLLYRVSESAP
jgi:hypothetical protein